MVQGRNSIKIKLFTEAEAGYYRADKQMKDWLKKTAKFITVIDTKFVMIGNSDTGVYFNFLVLFEEKTR